MAKRSPRRIAAAIPRGGNTLATSATSGAVSNSPWVIVLPSSGPSTKSRARVAPRHASAGRSVRITCSKRRFDQMSAAALAAALKRSALAASREPLIAPAEAPAMIANGDGRSLSAGSSERRFRTPAWYAPRAPPAVRTSPSMSCTPANGMPIPMRSGEPGAPGCPSSRRSAPGSRARGQEPNRLGRRARTGHGAQVAPRQRVAVGVGHAQLRQTPAGAPVAHDHGLVAAPEHPLVGPLAQRGQDGQQRFALRGEPVLEVLALAAHVDALEDLVLDEVLQARREHVLRDAEALLEVAEPARAEERVAHDQERPPV